MNQTYEFLPSQTFFNDNFESFAACEGEWLTREPNIVQWMITSTQETLADVQEMRPEMVGDAPFEALAAGKVVHVIAGFVRQQTDLPKCPLCGCSFEKRLGSISRRDNQTLICAGCGTREALGDLFNVR